MTKIISLLFLIFGGFPPIFAQDSSAVLSQKMSWDLSLTHSANSINSRFVTRSAGIISATLLPASIGIPATLITFGNLGVYDKAENENQPNIYLAETGVLVGTSEVLTYSLTLALKSLTKRPRPYIAHPDAIIHREDESLYSFPSGHAAGSAAIATMMSLRYPKWYVIAPAAVWSLGMSFSRMHLGVHYWSDVVAGTALGVGVSALVYGLRGKILPAMHFLLPEKMEQVAMPLLSLNRNFQLLALPDGGALRYVAVL